MPSRNVSFIGQNIQQSNSIASFFPSRWSNYSLTIWLPTESVMLRLELHQSWSDENFVWFKRVPCISPVELKRRKIGCTEWSDEAIVVEALISSPWFHECYNDFCEPLGIKIIAPGPPYASTKRWHFFWADHQSFVEALANIITKNPPPHDSPSMPIHRGMEALVDWDSKFQNLPLYLIHSVHNSDHFSNWRRRNF